MILPKRFDISPPDWGMLRRSRCVQIFLQNYKSRCTIDIPFILAVNKRKATQIFFFHLPSAVLALIFIGRRIHPSLSLVDSVCVCVFSSHSFWTSSSLDVPVGVTQEEGHTGFLIHLLSAVRALIFLARRIQPFLSLVNREVEFCVLTI